MYSVNGHWQYVSESMFKKHADKDSHMFPYITRSNKVNARDWNNASRASLTMKAESRHTSWAVYCNISPTKSNHNVTHMRFDLHIKQTLKKFHQYPTEYIVSGDIENYLTDILPSCLPNKIHLYDFWLPVINGLKNV